ncbi:MULTISPECIES: ABC transporter ATP-binding protein [unclassified Duganella]|uniref:ABC transporter ATP-binding protein n=1 Tax=unclassified Duganella TaxID=2636909 RepID=UPI00088EA715|nr:MULTISPECIES: ABC transporter ATP-binding protein [unclassified Duganella]SDF74971.1 branched-chain amino acid transport system ATP-binding protein [Duganella sp. OV458]SDI54577.1 amino acid/amide ABC transporter ATP-binding protein 2, HAAT family [Duganella sp. OV510]
MLTLEKVSLAYGGFQALHSIDIHAAEGELVVLLGANGAGKSSIFHTISGLRRAKAGSIRFDGRELVGRKPAHIVADGLVHCPEGRQLFPGMSVLKNLMLGGYVHRRDSRGSQRILDEVFGLFPILHEKKDCPAGSLSGGQQQMVAIGRALMGRPKALLLDEPSLGLAPLVVRQMFEIIARINQAGTTVLLAEQNAYAALNIASRAYVIEQGKIVLEGSREELLGNEQVRKAYIGA